MCGPRAARAQVTTILDVGGANPKPCFSNGLFQDGDGIADVKQISSKELVQRKIGVVAKAIDPELVADAVTAINAGLMAVVAT